LYVKEADSSREVAVVQGEYSSVIAVQSREREREREREKPPAGILNTKLEHSAQKERVRLKTNREAA
jgi:hypothetical protein